MSLAALVLAAAASAAPAPAQTAAPMPNLYNPPARCSELRDQIVRRQLAAMGGRRPAAQYAVLRQVDGCGVPAPVGYHQDYLLPGAADVRPGDGPGNRR